MTPLIIITVTTLSSLMSTEGVRTAYKCNADFQKKIEDKVWSEYGKPDHILDNGAKAGKEFLIRATNNYHRKDDGVTCIYTEFGTDGKTVKLTTVSGSVTTPHGETPMVEHQETATVEETDSHIKRVHLYSKDDIVVWYKCKDDGPVGPIDVAMKVQPHSYNEEKVTNVVNMLREKLGIELTETYPHDCAQENND